MEEKKCEKCGAKIGFFNGSFNHKLCNKCFSKPITMIVGGIILGIILIFIFSSGGNSDKTTGNNQQKSLASLQAEVSPYGGTLYMYSVTNRNDYPWYNVEIIVDDYYSCNGALNTLDSGSQTTVLLTPSCKDSNGNSDMGTIIKSLKVKTDEGSQYFTLQGYG